MSKTDQKEFYQRAEKFIDKLMEQAPVIATQLGDHRFDALLRNYSKHALERQQQEVREALMEFESFDTVDFELDARIDQHLMVQITRSILRGFKHEKLQLHLRYPGMYSDECLGGVFQLLIREFAPIPERLKSVIGRLKAAPHVLAQGKENIVPWEVPLVWNKVALESTQQGMALFTMLIPALARQAPDLQAELNEAAEAAVEALQDWIKFLKEILPQAKGDFPVGKELFEELLREDHLLDYTTDDLLEMGWRLFEKTQAEMEQIAREINPAKSAKEILEEAKADHPRADELMDVYRKEMAKVRVFVLAHDIATIPAGESLKIEPTPSFLRGITPYAAYIMPGPLERVQEGIFLVTPVDPEGTKEEQEENLKGHNYVKLPMTVFHEAYPGHHLQLTCANTVGSLPRKLGSFVSSLFIEGWALYCEELLERFGYIDKPMQRLGRLSNQLWRAARIILDVSLHMGTMSVEEGIDFLVVRVGLERSNALAEVRRYTLSPTQPMSYLMGKLEIVGIIDEYKRKHPKVSLRDLHDALLSHGSLPPRLLRKRLLALIETQ